MKTLLTLLLSLFIQIGISQSIYFNYTDGSQSSYELKDVHKITFDDDIMNLYLLDGTLYSWNVYDIDHYKYKESEEVSVKDVLEFGNKINVFPNPVSDVVNVKYDLEVEKLVISLYSISGKLLKQRNINDTQSGITNLNLSMLPSGYYVITISGDNFNITKKIIKL